MFDQDKSGVIDFDEFMEMLKYLRLPLERNHALRIFSEAHRGNGTMGQDEFEKALGLIEDKVDFASALPRPLPRPSSHPLLRPLPRPFRFAFLSFTTSPCTSGRCTHT